MSLNPLETISIAIVSVILIFCLYVAFVIMPVALYADAKCLRNGYPQSHVTVGLETYCSNLDGSVTVKVEKLK